MLELLMVVAVIGLLAGFAIPGLMNSLHRGKQKRTVSDLRSIATALESYAIDTGHYPDGSGTSSILIAPLASQFMRIVPTSDGWDHVVLYERLDLWPTEPNTSCCHAGATG